MDTKCILCSKALAQPEGCFLPCRHGGVCAKCAAVIVKNKFSDEQILGCPICKQHITAFGIPNNQAYIIQPPLLWKDDEYKAKWRLIATMQAIPIQEIKEEN
jgi:phage FluMu protein Com